MSTIDETIYALHMDGRRVAEIAAALGMKDTRVMHELNRILNEKAGWFGLRDRRNTFRAGDGTYA